MWRSLEWTQKEVNLLNSNVKLNLEKIIVGKNNENINIIIKNEVLQLNITMIISFIINLFECLVTK